MGSGHGGQVTVFRGVGMAGSCERCGVGFVGRPDKRFCSERCRAARERRRFNKRKRLALAAKKREQRLGLVLTCAVCAGSFSPKIATGPVPMFCSPECRRQRDKQTASERARRAAANRVVVSVFLCCPECQQEFQVPIVKNGSRTIYCSERCRDRSMKRKRTCGDCGNATNKPTAAKFCNPCFEARTDRLRLERQQAYAVLAETERNRKRARVLREQAASGLSAHGRRLLLAKWKRQGKCCAYCQRPADTVEHVVPLSRGGSNHEGNLVPACRSCNASKGDRLIVEWKYATWTATAASRAA